MFMAGTGSRSPSLFSPAVVVCYPFHHTTRKIMLAPNKPLVGSVFERTPRSSMSSPSTPRTNGSTTGFPVARHRLKSARNQEAEQSADVLPSQAAVPPVVQRVTRTQKQVPSEEQPDMDDWRVRMSEENERRVAAMADEEREQERREIEEKFGKNIGDVLKRARMAREAHKMQKKAMASLEGDTSDGTVLPSVPPGSYKVKLSYSWI